MERANKLAGTLDWLVREGLIPGLLPKDVSEAAELLRSQAAEIESLTRTLAASRHTVTAKRMPGNDPFRVVIRGEVAIADPRRYFGEVTIDQMRLADPHFVPHLARSLARNMTAEWLNEIEEQTARVVSAAVVKEANP